MIMNDSSKLQSEPIAEDEEKKLASHSENRQDSVESTRRIVSHVPLPAKVSVGGTISTESSLSSITASVCDPRSRTRSDGTLQTPLSSGGDSVRSAHANQGGELAEPSLSHNDVCNTAGANADRKRSVDAIDGESKDITAIPKKPRQEIVLSKLQEIAPAPAKITPLARATDTEVLSPLHTFVRQQIEVFTATHAEMSQPAPGRKNPVRLNQVGLRCIHCRDFSVRERVKRAVCYPSSVGRVYHSVSDMKFDHFGNCKGMPADLRAKFVELKAESKSKKDNRKPKGTIGSSSSTAQYYNDTARQMGMKDGQGGVFMEKGLCLVSGKGPTLVPGESSQPTQQSCLPPKSQEQSLKGTGPIFQASKALNDPAQPQPHTFGSSYTVHQVQPPLDGNAPPAVALGQKLYSQSLSQQAIAPFLISMMMLRNAREHTQAAAPEKPSGQQSSRMLLCSPTDPEYLNPLHCFVRRNVEVFAADKDDVAAPAPGRKSRVRLGQVGIRCIHCARLPIKDRVKRAVCYPPSLSQIYHAVSNMKFDHFGICPGLPPQEREEFSKLRAAYKRKRSPIGGGSSQGKGASNSTAQYYQDSAIRLGLVDTVDGIRFKTVDPPLVTEPEKVQQGRKEVVPDGISALMIAATGCSGLTSEHV